MALAPWAPVRVPLLYNLFWDRYHSIKVGAAIAQTRCDHRWDTPPPQPLPWMGSPPFRHVVFSTSRKAFVPDHLAFFLSSWMGEGSGGGRLPCVCVCVCLPGVPIHTTPTPTPTE